MPAHERTPGPSVRFNPPGCGNARNRSVTMSELMWRDTEDAATSESLRFSEWARRVLARALNEKGYPGYSADGLTYPADRRADL